LFSSRRDFLVKSGALLALPFIPRTSFAADADVVIIGAGSSGLSAAQTLIDANVSFQLLEAGNRIGGRAYTDSTTFGVPFDQGCWLQHSSISNPWVKFAIKHGFDIGPMPSALGHRVWVGSRQAYFTERQAMSKTYRKMRTAIVQAAASDRDISARHAIEKLERNQWSSMVEGWVSSGRDLDELSTRDWWMRGGAGPNYHCGAGYGTLVSKFGKNIPVNLNTPVTEIDWSGKGVRVQTDSGVLAARYCIITVSNGVLAAEGIRFKPSLPQWKADAIQAIQMANKLIVVLQFKQPQVLPCDQNNWFSYWTPDGRDIPFASNVGGWGVQRGAVGGQLANELSMAGPQATINFALEGLQSALGSRVRQDFVKGWVSSWVDNPFFRGTWSMAKPGKANRRDGLRHPVGDRLMFAGEACHEFMYSTCHGAYLSGKEVAIEVVGRLGK